MASLEKILKELKIGKEALNTQEQLNSLLECFDVSCSLFLTSKRIVESSTGMTINEDALLSLKKIVDSFKDFENKTLNEEEISAIQKRMISDSIVLQSKKFLQEAEASPKIDSEKVGKTIAAINYGLRMILEDTSFNVKQIKSSKMNIEDERLIEEGFINEVL